MPAIYYFKFIGARVYQEKLNRGLNLDSPLAIAFQDTLLDCDEKMFKSGVRPGDTTRQAKLASPFSRIIPVTDPSSKALKSILDVFASLTPFVEPDEEGCGIFIEVSKNKPFPKILGLLEHMFHIAVVTKSYSKSLAKSSSVWASEKLFQNRKISSGKVEYIKKPWGHLELGPNYALIDINPGKEAIYSASMPLSLLWLLPTDVISHLYALGLNTFKDLQLTTTNQLKDQIGDWAYMVVDWVKGMDRTSIKPIHPKPCIEKTVNLDTAPDLLTPQVLEPALRETSEELIQKCIGFKHLTVTLSGSFPSMVQEKRLVRPVCKFEPLQAIVLKLLEKMLRELQHETLVEHVAVSLSFKAIEKMPVKQEALIQIQPGGGIKGVPEALEVTLTGIEEKYGGLALIWGVNDGHKHSKAFKSEVIRREKMLAFWDPVRFDKTQMPAS